MQENLNFPVVCFGETLWDFLPQGKLPGGAPVNVACHLRQLGKNPAVITRVGNDELGKELKEVYRVKHIDTRFFQEDDAHPTGKVYATLKEDHEVVYDIVAPVAWDFIEYRQDVDQVVAEADYFVFGSLASRNGVTRASLLRYLQSAKIKVFDVNLRPPHYERQLIETLLQHTDILKVNLSELQLISAWYGHSGSEEDLIRHLRRKFHLQIVIVTKGGDGALLFMHHQLYHHPGYRVAVSDTVGSGDAFLAAMISQLMDDAVPADALAFACALGALVASRPGASPSYGPGDIAALMKNTDR